MTMVKTDPGTVTRAAMPSGATTRVSSIYLASAESDTGKSAIALGLLHLLAASAARVGVFWPIVRSAEETDYLLELLHDHVTATLDNHGQCVGRDLRASPGGS
jgi:phosphate acetyltransferase